MDMSGGWAEALRVPFTPAQPNGRSGAGTPFSQRTCSWISCSSELLSIEPGRSGVDGHGREGLLCG